MRSQCAVAALCVTLDSTVAVSCTRTDDVVQSVVARSIIRPPVGNHRDHLRDHITSPANRNGITNFNEFFVYF